MTNGGVTSTFERGKMDLKEVNLEFRRQKSLILSSAGPSRTSTMKRRQSSVDFILNRNDELAYLPWECVSLFRRDSGTTLNFYLKRRDELMAFISVLAYHIHGSEAHQEFMSLTVMMQFKMKLSYSNWKRNLSTSQNIQRSIRKTIQEKYSLCARNLQQFISHEDGVPFYVGEQ